MSSAVTSWGTEGPDLLSEPPAVARFGLEGQDALLSTYILRRKECVIALIGAGVDERRPRCPSLSGRFLNTASKYLFPRC
jgi:hypothetical protein